jgi:site-specific recombinase XerD
VAVLTDLGSPTLDALQPSFRRHLLASNKSPKTVKVYLAGLRVLTDFLHGQGMPSQAASVRREHVEAFLVDRMQRVKPATASIEYRALQQFWKWCVEEGECNNSPMSRMRPPIVPEEPPAVLSPDQLSRLLAACEGRALVDRRDMAIIRLLLDTGMRRAELTGLKVSDVDLQDATALVLGKGRRPRAVPFGRKSAQALDRYLRVRSLHSQVDSEALWLGRAG